MGLASMMVVLVSLQDSKDLFADLVSDTRSDGEDFISQVEKIKDADRTNQRWVKLWYVVTIVSWVFVGMGKYQKKNDDEPKNVKNNK